VLPRPSQISRCTHAAIAARTRIRPHTATGCGARVPERREVPSRTPGPQLRWQCCFILHGVRTPRRTALRLRSRVSGTMICAEMLLLTAARREAAATARAMIGRRRLRRRATARACVQLPRASVSFSAR
jgi:hypothetical protein